MESNQSRDGEKTLDEIDKFARANEMLDSATTAKFFIYDNVYVIRQPKQFPRQPSLSRTLVRKWALIYCHPRKGKAPGKEESTK